MKEKEDEHAVQEEHDLQDKHDVKDEHDVRDEHDVKVELDIQDEHKEQNKREDSCEKMCNEHEKSIDKKSISKQQTIVAQQNRSIQVIFSIYQNMLLTLSRN